MKVTYKTDKIVLSNHMREINKYNHATTRIAKEFHGINSGDKAVMHVNKLWYSDRY